MKVFYAAYVLSLSIVSLAVAAVGDIPNTATFDELIGTSRPINSGNDIVNVEKQLWDKYVQALTSNPEHMRDISTRELKYGDKTMRYSFEQRGSAGPNGFPLYIALHGGGAAGAWLNDSQWEHMKIYYKESVDNGVYVATRGVTDTWNLHFVDESYPLYDRLITDLIAFANVDPNRVYITGFSAGGDGVYQIAARMPDRWAAANMSAGHNNWIAFDNLYNLPLLLQMGAKDGAYGRNKNAAESALKLKELASLRGGYKSDLFLHAGGSHNSWRDNNPSGGEQPIITNISEWLSGEAPLTAQANTNAVHWLKENVRNPYPLEIYWDYQVNALRDYAPGKSLLSQANQARLAMPKQLIYWLNVLDADKSEGSLLHAQIMPVHNSIHLSGIKSVRHLRVLLRTSMIDFNRPVTVVIDDQQLASVTLRPDMQVMVRTLLERGDPNYMFSAEIELIKENGLWRIVTAPSAYSYCSKTSCKVFDGVAQQLFFGPLPESVARVCVDSSMYALTFDDGPTQKWDELLPLLDLYGVKATFFVNGRNIDSPEQKARLLRAHQAGHQVSNHSHNHRNFLELDEAAIKNEVEQTKISILEVIGDDARAVTGASMVRAPFGYSDQRVVDILAKNGYRTVRWNSDRYDWELQSDQASLYMDRFLNHLAFLDANKGQGLNMSLIDVNHDRAQPTLDSLPSLISTLRSRGYRFVTVAECLGVS